MKRYLKILGLKNIKIMFFQIYSLANHIVQIIRRKPGGGHEYFKHSVSDKEKDEYIKSLVSNFKTNTPIAIASN